MKTGLEIERKYLIRMPDIQKIAAMPGCETWDIVQTYLLDGIDGSTRRVRSICCEGKIRYVHTVKHRISSLSSRESEGEVSAEEYAALLEGANPALQAVKKTRYRVPYCGRKLEIDIYSFWNDRATLEIELDSEDETPMVPDWISIVRDVTGERAYRNRFLAEEVPMEALE